MMFLIRPISVALVFLILGLSMWGWFLIGVPVMIADVRARYIDYRRLLGVKYTDRAAKYVGLSWCGRGVGIAVWGDAAKSFYIYKGYMWWHILPDGFPLVFLRLAFWKSVLGIR